jgi:hypothetical protein
MIVIKTEEKVSLKDEDLLSIISIIDKTVEINIKTVANSITAIYSIHKKLIIIFCV